MIPGRREFLGGVASLPALLGTSGPPAGRDVYQELGVRTLVNAAGTYTSLSATLVPREVVEAMEAASRKYVNLVELHQAAGRKIAALVGCEAALVTSGAAAALTLGTAACVAGTDREKIRRLPDTAGMKNEVLIQKSHRYGYDRAVRNAGVRLVEVETRDDLERAAAGGRAAMMLYYNRHEPLGRIKAEEFVALGKKLGIPTLNDAAADIPPAENLSRFTKMGFDLVTISGGKALRGPQCAGLLLGRKDLVEAAALHNNPHTDTIGRAFKVAKEEIVGMWAAVDHYLKQDAAAVWREWERRCKAVAAHLSDVPGVRTETFVPPIANAAPHLRVAWDGGLKPAEVMRLMREGDPRIELRPEAIEGGVEVSVWTLEPGEEEIVGRRLREVLKK